MKEEMQFVYHSKDDNNSLTMQEQLKSLCRICLFNNNAEVKIGRTDAFNDDLIDEADNKKQEINIDHHHIHMNSIQKMFSIHQTMIGKCLVRDLISNITQLEITEDDQLPDQICAECLDRLHIANHFRMQFLSSSNLLQKILPKSLQTHTLQTAANRNKIFSCCLCPCRFRSEIKLLKHAELTHSSKILEPSRYTSEFPIACVACNRRFTSWRELQRHRRENFKELKINAYECAHCDAKFTDRGYLTNHLKVHAGKQLFCEYCSANFTRIDHLKAHIQTQHGVGAVGEGGKCFVCDICSLQFTLKQNLQVHMRVHTKERKFECSYCRKRYAYLCDLKRHLFQHEGNSPYQCQICQKAFYSKSNLNVHLRSHQGLKKFSCEICCQKFTQKVSLENHRKSIHKIQK